MPKMRKSPNATRCASCRSEMPPQAKFCPKCGAPVGGPAAGRQWRWKDIALVVAIAATVSFGLTYLAGRLATEKDAPQASRQPADTASGAPARNPVDLSTMTPREAADRLFNRVMAADERGDAAEVARFTPMALMAYQRVEPLDADARYHVGLLNMLAGNTDAVRAEIEQLRRESPDHLLGLMLAFNLAEKTGDAKGAAAARARFAAAYESEIASSRPEYEAHRATIVKFRTDATVPKTAGAAGAMKDPAQRGAQVFAEKCAICHGPAASGSDKGPPLVHKIYEPGHHGDGAFFRAVRQGVKAHHWPFGDMPPVPGVTDAQIRQIVAYVRGLQAKAGIR